MVREATAEQQRAESELDGVITRAEEAEEKAADLKRSLRTLVDDVRDLIDSAEADF